MGDRTANWTDKAAFLVEIDFVDAADPAPIGDRVDVMLVLCEAYHLAFDCWKASTFERFKKPSSPFSFLRRKVHA
jgi:hypothetical protein